MVKGITENNDFNTKRQSQVIDSRRRKILMKKLQKIKLNKSCGNISCDMRAFYEEKLRKLRNNNHSLAKALSEQRHLTQSWYDEVVILKERIYDIEADSNSYMNTDFAAAIKNAAGKQIKEIADPLQTLTKECLEHVLELADGLKNVSHLVTSLNKINKDQKNFSPKSLIASNGKDTTSSLSQIFRPLKRNFHSLVVDKHLQLSNMDLSPQMNLDENSKYTSQERAENEDHQMPTIEEEITFLKKDEKVSSFESDQELEVLRDDQSCDSSLDECLLPCEDSETIDLQNTLSEPDTPTMKIEDRYMIEPRMADESGSSEDSSPSKGHAEESSDSNRTRLSFNRAYLCDSSDEESGGNPPKRKDSLPSSSPDVCVPVFRLSRERIESRVSRRVRKRSKLSHGDAPIMDQILPKPPSRDCEILKLESSADCSPNRVSSVTPAGSVGGAGIAPSSALVDLDADSTREAGGDVPLVNPASDLNRQQNDRKVNTTCLLESSMEMTDCLHKNLFLELAAAMDKEQGQKARSDVKETTHAKSRRFFKGIEFDEAARVSKTMEDNPYDLSLIDASVIDLRDIEKRQDLPQIGKSDEEGRRKNGPVSSQDVEKDFILSGSDETRQDIDSLKSKEVPSDVIHWRNSNEFSSDEASSNATKKVKKTQANGKHKPTRNKKRPPQIDGKDPCIREGSLQSRKNEENAVYDAKMDLSTEVNQSPVGKVSAKEGDDKSLRIWTILERDHPEDIRSAQESDRSSLLTSREEMTNTRPRRAAAKITSFKEPPLNSKLRQDILKKNSKMKKSHKNKTKIGMKPNKTFELE